MSEHASSSLLDDPRYFDYLAVTHPSLRINDRDLPLPSFVAPLDTSEPLLPGAWRTLVNAASHVVERQVRPPSLFLGTPFERYDQTHLLDEVEDVPALVEQAKAAAAEEHLDCVVVTNLGPEHPRVGDLLAEGFVALPSFPDTVVDLSPASFDEHLARLPAGDRSGIRRNIRHFEQAGHRLERLSSTRDCADALYAAYLPFFERARVKWQPHTLAYFKGLADLDERVHVFAAREPGGDIIGFIVSFEDGEDFQSARVGVRPDYYRRDAVYFRLIYHVVEDALGRTGRQLSLEPTGYRMKRHLGATARPLINLVLGVSPAWRLLLSTFSGLGRHMLSHLNDPSTLERNY